MNLTGQAVYQKGAKPVKSAPIRRASQGAECQLKIPGVCRHDPAYTVGCHMRFFGMAGMGQKPDDIFIIDGCDKCHAVFDSRDKWAAAGIGWEDVLCAFMATLRARRTSGLITLEGETG